ncbi:hypothetical protein H4R24_002034 [Coemansia sp. RSA 988]|nr:hypothetical protein H4R24_002034 [Coemansia sp. RSA 988]
MVSFVCNYCQQTLKKPKLDQHVQRCRNASFSCIDCSVDFVGTTYRQHTSCISEVEKYGGKKQIKGKTGSAQQKQAAPTPKSTVDQLTAKVCELQDDDISTQSSVVTSIVTESKKRKNVTVNKNSTKKPKEKDVDAEWNNIELTSVAADALVSAIIHVLKQVPDRKFDDLRKKAVKLVTKHPKSSLSKSEVKKAFDSAVITALSQGSVSLSL